jgi:chromate transporter
MLNLIWIFLTIGTLTIGGGLVAIPLIQQQVVDAGYISIIRLTQMISISESTPGPIGMNMATYVGFELYGFLGAIVISVSFLLPSFVMIALLYQPLIRVQKHFYTKRLFLYIKASVIGFIGYALFKVFEVAIFDDRSMIFNQIDIKMIGIILFLSLVHIKIKNPIVIIIIGAICGVMLYQI